jgi:prevent-host-death family protein
MIENTVSASHFRVHFKEIANSVARGAEACTVARHGLEIVALVSLEDLEFLRKHKWGKEAPKPKPEPEMIRLVHPSHMSLELLQEAYEMTAGSTDFEIIGWRYKAYYSIMERTGKFPDRKWSG